MKPYYQDDFATIYHGDCLDENMLETWFAGDVLVTDPPYGISYAGAEGGPWNGWESARRFRDVAIYNDSDTDSRDSVLYWWGDNPALVFGSWKAPKPEGTRATLTWEKGDHTGMGDLTLPWKPNTEEIYVLGTGFIGPRTTSVLRINAASPNFGTRHHPTEKPLELMTTLLQKCPPGLVVDPFMGSGSTLRSAKDLGRRSIGIEVEERYCEIAAKRLAQEVLDFGGAA